MRRKGPGEPTGVRLDADAAEALRLRSLLAVVLRAVALQPEADEVLAACAAPSETSSVIARRGQRVAADYCRLYGWAMDLCGNDPVDSLPHRITQLLHYHAELIDVALKLAFPRYRSAELERRRMALTGLGEPAQVLRDAEVALRLWIDELSS
ncbi:MAG TPA: hypothetical protein VJ914_14870 [Pseudonocardiaceae bacterium]|nr:hypothetical protein [Pseudonocardiaceae bacterium]